MKTLTKILLAIEAMVILGFLGIAWSAHKSAKRDHTPISRPLITPDQKVVERAKSWTVLISNEGFEQKYRGTGMLIDSTHVLTADHMVSTNGNEMWIYVYPGRRIVHGKAVSEDSRNDLAVLELDEKVELPAYATFQENHYDGQPIIILGNILGGMHWYVSYGIISGDWGPYILMDGTMTHGDSGGPWIDMKGAVVGLSDWQLGDEEPQERIKGGVSAKTIRKFLKRPSSVEPTASEIYTVRQSEPIHRLPL